MEKDILTIKFDTNPSPWFQKIVEINFSRKKLQPIVDELVAECSNKDYSSSYQYNHHVDRVIEKHYNKELGSMRPLLKAVREIISEQYPPKEKLSWSNGHVAALRSLENKMAWMTPGFAEARRYNEIYGS
jgi:hypothetical protein